MPHATDDVIRDFGAYKKKICHVNIFVEYNECV